jgi:kynurenine formamidase
MSVKCSSVYLAVGFAFAAGWMSTRTPAAGVSRAQSSANSAQTTTKAEFEKMMTDLSNWGRWGKDDQLGTINLITPAKRREAAAQVTEGFSVSLARDTDTEKAIDNANPLEHKMSVGVDNEFNMDSYSVFFHGFGHTHFDALSHVFYQGRMYNGFPQTSVTSNGAKYLAATNYADGVFTRGVLVDIAALRNVPYLQTTDLITTNDLDAWEKKTGVHIQSGDAVFIRTGRWARRAALGPWDIGSHSAGLDPSTARWMKQRNIALLGGDGASDAIPSPVEGVNFPIHLLVIVAMGTPMLDQCDLENLAKSAATRNRYTFLLSFAPIRLKGGTGSLVNPIAVF